MSAATDGPRIAVPRDSAHGDVAHMSAGRFGIAAGMSGWGWHAVDLELVGPQLAKIHAENRKRIDGDVFSVCGVRAQMVRKLGPFTYGSRWLRRLRCERCSWVVALSRGTVEQEIDLYTADAGGDALGDLLRQIFTAMLADAPPGPEAEAGHRSDLLAHASRHRPVMTVCERHCHVGECRRTWKDRWGEHRNGVVLNDNGD